MNARMPPVCTIAAVFAAATAALAAETYPAKPVRFIVGFTPGGGFGAVAKVMARGGRARCDGQAVSVEGAHEVLIIASLFRGRATAQALRRARAAIDAVRPDYAALLRRHAELHRKLYGRVELELTAGRDADKPNEKTAGKDLYFG